MESLWRFGPEVPVGIDAGLTLVLTAVTLPKQDFLSDHSVTGIHSCPLNTSAPGLGWFGELHVAVNNDRRTTEGKFAVAENIHSS